MIIFPDDLKYWGIEEKYLEMCCLNKFTTRKEAIMDEINKELLNMNEVKPVNEFPNSIYGQYMKFVWVGGYIVLTGTNYLYLVMPIFLPIMLIF